MNEKKIPPLIFPKISSPLPPLSFSAFIIPCPQTQEKKIKEQKKKKTENTRNRERFHHPTNLCLLPPPILIKVPIFFPQFSIFILPFPPRIPFSPSFYPNFPPNNPVSSPVAKSKIHCTRILTFQSTKIFFFLHARFVLLVVPPMSLLPKKSDEEDLPDSSSSIEIREVWDSNLEQEFALIRDIVDDFPYVAMDTEFPGVVLRPVGTFKSSQEFHYQTLRDNVNLLKLIQLGLTFSDHLGNLPIIEATENHRRFCIWQFNFREFDVNEDVFANDSIELLRQSGIDFNKNNRDGIDARRFGELVMSSGIVLNDSVHWVTFHSGYDFGYLLKLLTCQNLPDTQARFFELIHMYFPRLYDIKHLMRFCNSLHGGLNKLAELLEVQRVGVSHQAGSDSLLTSRSFMKLKKSFFSGSLDKYAGVLYGLGSDGSGGGGHSFSSSS